MTFRQIHKLLTYLLSGLGLAGLSFGGELRGATLMMVAVAYGGSALCEQPLIGRRWWIRGWNALVVLSLLVQLARGIAGESILSLGIEYAALLQVSRLFNRRGAAEHQQVAVLALLHLVATTVLTSEISYAFVFLGFVLTTPWMLAVSHLRFELEQSLGEADDRAAMPVKEGESESPGLQALLASKKLITPRFFVATGALTLPIFLVTLVLFLLFPRVGLGFLPTSQTTAAATTGFGAEVQLGNFGTIRDDPTVALRFWPEGAAAFAAQLPLRFRGTSFDRYDGTTWGRSLTQRETISQYGHFFSLSRPGRPSDLQVRIEVEPLPEPVLFLPDHTVALEVPPLARRSGRLMRRLTRGSGLDIRYDDSISGIRYVAHLSADERRVPEEGPEQAGLDSYLQLPEHYGADSRLAKEARRLTAGIESDQEKALRIQRWLQDPSRFRYSLTQPDVEGKDPLEVFLFEKRFGHCEYFSSALALMLRSVGVPTRNVTGFVGGEYNSYGGYFVIRQGDAHSWVEIWADGAWRVFDPTPAAELEPPPRWQREFYALYDALVSRWRRNVVGYDLKQQVSLFQNLLSWFDKSPQQKREQAQEPSSLPSMPTIGWPWLIVLALLAVALLIWRAILQRRATKPPGPEALVVALDKKMKRLGWERPAHRTPLEQLEVLRRDDFQDLDRVESVTDRYLLARFAQNAPLSGEEMQHWLDQIERLGAG